MPDGLLASLYNRFIGPQTHLPSNYKPEPLSGEAMAYGEQINKPKTSLGQPNPDLPALPSLPSAFRPDPVVVGDQLLATLTHRMLNSVPELRGQVSKVVKGHTQASMDEHSRSNLPQDAFGHTNLNGVYDSRNGEIGINPSLGDDQTKYTLAHEMAHAGGAGEVKARLMTDELFPEAHNVDDYIKLMQQELASRRK